MDGHVLQVLDACFACRMCWVKYLVFKKRTKSNNLSLTYKNFGEQRSVLSIYKYTVCLSVKQGKFLFSITLCTTKEVIAVELKNLLLLSECA